MVAVWWLYGGCMVAVWWLYGGCMVVCMVVCMVAAFEPLWTSLGCHVHFVKLMARQNTRLSHSVVLDRRSVIFTDV